MAGGRKSKYKPEYAEQARKICALGAIDADLADFFKVNRDTVNQWRLTFPEFAEALKLGKEVADERVKRSLYHKAVGYSHDAVKILIVNGKVRKIPYIEQFAPDTTACIFWLKNRDPANWRDRTEVANTFDVLGSMNDDAESVQADEPGPAAPVL